MTDSVYDFEPEVLDEEFEKFQKADLGDICKDLMEKGVGEKELKDIADKYQLLSIPGTKLYKGIEIFEEIIIFGIVSIPVFYITNAVTNFFTGNPESGISYVINKIMSVSMGIAAGLNIASHINVKNEFSFYKELNEKYKI